MAMTVSKFLEAKRRLEEYTEKLRKIEEEGRSRAYNRDSLPESDEDWAIYASMTLKDTLDPIELILIDKELLDKYNNFVKELRDSLRHDIEKEAFECRFNDVKRKDCIIPYNPFAYVDKASENLFGAKCTWLAGEVPPEKYTLSSALNDASACIHRTIDFLEKYTKNWHIEGKCMWIE